MRLNWLACLVPWMAAAAWGSPLEVPGATPVDVDFGFRGVISEDAVRIDDKDLLGPAQHRFQRMTNIRRFVERRYDDGQRQSEHGNSRGVLVVGQGLSSHEQLDVADGCDFLFAEPFPTRWLQQSHRATA